MKRIQIRNQDTRQVSAALAQGLRGVAIVFFVLFATVGLIGCAEQDGPMEEAGEAIDEAVDDVQDAVEDAGEAIDEAIDGGEGAMEEAGEAMDEAGAAVEEAAEEATGDGTEG